ncbi:MAG: winged helix-turn-helix domain-containing protein, partial [Dehalococcoidia bacterium]
IHTRRYAASDVLVALAKNGCTTTERPHDNDTTDLVEALSPDVVVLAIDPARNDDNSLVDEMAQTDSSAVIVITPNDDHAARSAALAAGADLCLKDTDGPDVIAAQLTAVLRRLTPAGRAVPENGSVVVVRDLSLDFDRCQAIRGGEPLPLTPTEFKILAHLARNAGRVISPVEILRAVQEYTYTEREAQEIVKVYIRRIRRKIEHDPSDPSYVVNIRGFGYMLEHQERPPGRRTEAA